MYASGVLLSIFVLFRLALMHHNRVAVQVRESSETTNWRFHQIDDELDAVLPQANHGQRKVRHPKFTGTHPLGRVPSTPVEAVWN